MLPDKSQNTPSSRIIVGLSLTILVITIVIAVTYLQNTISIKSFDDSSRLLSRSIIEFNPTTQDLNLLNNKMLQHIDNGIVLLDSTVLRRQQRIDIAFSLCTPLEKYYLIIEKTNQTIRFNETESNGEKYGHLIRKFEPHNILLQKTNNYGLTYDLKACLNNLKAYENFLENR